MQHINQGVPASGLPVATRGGRPVLPHPVRGRALRVPSPTQCAATRPSWVPTITVFTGLRMWRMRSSISNQPARPSCGPMRSRASSPMTIGREPGDRHDHLAPAGATCIEDHARRNRGRSIPRLGHRHAYVEGTRTAEALRLRPIERHRRGILASAAEQGVGCPSRANRSDHLTRGRRSRRPDQKPRIVGHRTERRVRQVLGR